MKLFKHTHTHKPKTSAMLYVNYHRKIFPESYDKREHQGDEPCRY